MSRPPLQGDQRGEQSQTRGLDGRPGYQEETAIGSPTAARWGSRQQGDGPYEYQAYREAGRPRPWRGHEGAYRPRQHDHRYRPSPAHQSQTSSFPHQHGTPPPIRLVPGQPPPFPIPSAAPRNPNHYPPQRHDQRQQHQPHPRHYQQQQHQETFAENQFPVQPLDRFKVNCAPFRQPIEIGSFSYDEQRNFIMDDSQLKYYFPPDLTKPNNLSVNYEKYVSRDCMVDEHIDALLDALIGIRDREQQHRDQDEKQGQTTTATAAAAAVPAPVSMTQADFICYRGLLTKIMCTPYASNEPWEMGATLYKGSIYIEEHISAEQRANAAGSNDRHKLMSYWGYRFETICNISKPVSELRRIKTRKRGGQSTPGESQDGRPHSRVAMSEDDQQQQQQEKVQETESESKETDPLDTQTSVEDQEHVKGKENEDQGGDPAEDDERDMIDRIDLEDPELTGRLDGIVDTNLQYCTVARTKIGKNSIIMGAEVDCTSEPKKQPPHNPLSDYIELKTSRVISSAREQNSFERYKLLKFWAQSFLPGIPTIIVGFRDDDGNVVTVETFKTMEIPRLDTTICINFLDGVLNFLRKQITVDDPEVSYTIRWAYPFKAIEVEYAGKGTSFLTERFLNCRSK
ncbi:hypothetical protein BGX29_005244 [Mortierella sp. GBA35]|nr:hypothetical protein BGX29_005244 [Mortierella sp. GBA35]